MIESIVRFFRSEPAPQQSTELNKISSLSNNLEHIPATPGVSEHYIAHGLVQVGNQPSQDVKTATRSRGSNFEFSTNVGQVSDNLVGRAVPECLNLRLPGKFVTFTSPEPGTRELVHVTEKPSRHLNEATFTSELKNHAKTKAAVSDVLDGLNHLGVPHPELDVNSTFDSVQQLVDSRLAIQDTLKNSFSSPKYLPTEQNSS